MGRIWRLVYRGSGSQALGQAGRPDRRAAWPGDRRAVQPVAHAPHGGDRFSRGRHRCRSSQAAWPGACGQADASPELKAHGAWVLHRLAKLDEATLLRLAGDNYALVRSHSRSIAGAQKLDGPGSLHGAGRPWRRFTARPPGRDGCPWPTPSPRPRPPPARSAGRCAGSR